MVPETKLWLLKVALMWLGLAVDVGELQQFCCLKADGGRGDMEFTF